ncbi:MAG: outer membrane beta-barrel protein [Bacteroidales bacterium]|nr:outer membrane beta-barrel protein [Bacteroidales bacterium]
MKNLLTEALLAALFAFLLVPVSAQGMGTDSATYSVKGRWVVKTSISLYRTWDTGPTVFGTGTRDNGAVGLQRFNFRAEASYAFTRHLEVGLFLGFQHYQYLAYRESLQPGFVYGELYNTIAPTFGANVTFQLLPLFVKSDACRWDLYLFARYGGCVLPFLEIENSGLEHLFHKYRQEYGVGAGVAYYFKNKVGLFGEWAVGNFSYFPFFTDSNINFRFGIAGKF